MPKPGFVPQRLKEWIEARERYRLSHAHIQMARELGMHPKSLRKLHNTGQQRWKAPLPIFIENLYFKRFGKIRPDEIKTVRQVAAAQQAKKRAKKLAREQEREPTPLPAPQAGEGRGGGWVQRKPARVATPNVIDLEDVFIEFDGDRDIPF